uniref:hypothetical protein n=1 Tax=Chitinophaga silvisoli TaxID=2291814 RepID=UPI00374254BC
MDQQGTAFYQDQAGRAASKYAPAQTGVGRVSPQGDLLPADSLFQNKEHTAGI